MIFRLGEKLKKINVWFTKKLEIVFSNEDVAKATTLLAIWVLLIIRKDVGKGANLL